MCAGLNCLYPLCSPLCTSWRPHGASYQTTSPELRVMHCRSCIVEQFAARHLHRISTALQKSAQDSLVPTLVFCGSVINLIRVAYAVQRPCSDFTDMLRCHISCYIIIIVIMNL